MGLALAVFLATNGCTPTHSPGDVPGLADGAPLSLAPRNGESKLLSEECIVGASYLKQLGYLARPTRPLVHNSGASDRWQHTKCQLTFLRVPQPNKAPATTPDPPLVSRYVVVYYWMNEYGHLLSVEVPKC